MHIGWLKALYAHWHFDNNSFIQCWTLLSVASEMKPIHFVFSMQTQYVFYYYSIEEQKLHFCNKTKQKHYLPKYQHFTISEFTSSGQIYVFYKTRSFRTKKRTLKVYCSSYVRKSQSSFSHGGMTDNIRCLTLIWPWKWKNKQKQSKKPRDGSVSNMSSRRQHRAKMSDNVDFFYFRCYFRSIWANDQNWIYKAYCYLSIS